MRQQPTFLHFTLYVLRISFFFPIHHFNLRPLVELRQVRGRNGLTRRNPFSDLNPPFRSAVPILPAALGQCRPARQRPC